ncbi:hypothetical protein B0H16DRAFT_1687113 [Mycena metata]|uniref:Uncharacterized protein n=1 Tax=Mycena metata TaxID=1033252 RepID=A0AAD7NM74_9AGAR|nr:hypothetical protein B0H16DRAFT_1687113 [Mycena metata]
MWRRRAPAEGLLESAQLPSLYHDDAIKQAGEDLKKKKPPQSARAKAEHAEAIKVSGFVHAALKDRERAFKDADKALKEAKKRAESKAEAGDAEETVFHWIASLFAPNTIARTRTRTWHELRARADVEPPRPQVCILVGADRVCVPRAIHAVRRIDAAAHRLVPSPSHTRTRTHTPRLFVAQPSADLGRVEVLSLRQGVRFLNNPVSTLTGDHRFIFPRPAAFDLNSEFSLHGCYPNFGFHNFKLQGHRPMLHSQPTCPQKKRRIDSWKEQHVVGGSRTHQSF